MFTNSIQFTANRLQERLVSIARNKKTAARDVTLAVRTWFELEFAKREWRGVPRVKPVDFEVAAMKRLKRAGARARFAAPLELAATSTPSDTIDEPQSKIAAKEPHHGNSKGISLKPKTVTAPPTTGQRGAVE
jgi:hypothetical protein